MECRLRQSPSPSGLFPPPGRQYVNTPDCTPGSATWLIKNAHRLPESLPIVIDQWREAISAGHAECEEQLLHPPQS